MSNRDNVNTTHKIFLYLTSLWLLFFMIIIITCDVPICFKDCEFIGFNNLIVRNIIPIVCILILVVIYIYLKFFIDKTSGAKNHRVKVNKITNKNYEHLTFLTTYIIPLICFDLSEIKYSIILLLLLIAIGAIYVKTDMFYANPTLALLGFHIYEIEGENKESNIGSSIEYKSVILISRDKLFEHDEIRMRKLDEKIYYVGRA
jgi:hypothetical protein